MWDKKSMGMGHGFRKQHGLIAHFTFDSPKYHDRATPNVIRCKRIPKNIQRHETQKPARALKRLIKVVCQPGGVVMDPFMGVGSTGLACLWTNRDFIGVELNRQYFELVKRLLHLAHNVGSLNNRAARREDSRIQTLGCISTVNETHAPPAVASADLIAGMIVRSDKVECDH